MSCSSPAVYLLYCFELCFAEIDEEVPDDLRLKERVHLGDLLFVCIVEERDLTRDEENFPGVRFARKLVDQSRQQMVVVESERRVYLHYLNVRACVDAPVTPLIVRFVERACAHLRR